MNIRIRTNDIENILLKHDDKFDKTLIGEKLISKIAYMRFFVVKHNKKLPLMILQAKINEYIFALYKKDPEKFDEYTIFILSNHGFYYLDVLNSPLSSEKIITTNKSILKKLAKIKFNKYDQERMDHLRINKLSYKQYREILKITNLDYFRNYFVETIRHFYENLPQRKSRQLTHAENYQLLCCEFSAQSEHLPDDAEKLKHNLYLRHVRHNIGRIEKMDFFKILFLYKLFDFKAYQYFNQNKFNFVALQDLLHHFANAKIGMPNFKLLWKHRQNEILLDLEFWKPFISILNQKLFDFVIAYPDLSNLKKFAHQYYNFKNNKIISKVTRHPLAVEIIKFSLEENLNKHELWQFIQNKELSFLIKIVDRLRVCDVSNTKNIIGFLQKELFESLWLLLQTMSDGQIKRHALYFTAKQHNYLKLKKIILLENTYHIEVKYLDVLINDNAIDLLANIFADLSKKNQLNQEMTDFICLNFRFPTLLYAIFKRVLSFVPKNRKQGLQLYEVMKSYVNYAECSLFSWLEKHNTKSAIEMHRDLLTIISAGFGEDSLIYISFPEELNDYSALPTQLYGLKNLVHDANLFSKYLQTRARFKKDQTIIHTKAFLECGLYFEEIYQLKLNVSMKQFFKNDHAMQVFLNKYNKLLNTSPNYLRLEFDYVFQKYNDCFNFLYFMFNDQCEIMLTKLLTTSVLQLNTALIHLHGFLNPAYFYTEYYINIYTLKYISQLRFESGALIAELMEYLNLIGANIFSDPSQKNVPFYKTLMEDLFLFAATTIGLTDKILMQKMRELLVLAFFKSMDLSVEMIKKKPDIFSLKQLCALSFAQTKHKDNAYMPILKILIQQHYQDTSIDKWLHEIEQHDTLGKMIANNNLLIQKELRQEKINVDMMLAYPFQRNFTVYGSKINKMDNLMMEIWNHLIKLSRQFSLLSFYINQLPPFKEKNLFAATCKKLHNYKQQIDKKLNKQPLTAEKTDLLLFMRNKVNMNLLVNLQAQIELIADMQLFAPLQYLQKTIKNLIANIRNLSLQITKQEAIKNETRPLKTQAWKKPRAFSIYVWNKTNPLTFFLGDHLNCCLATTKEQFPAILQRIIDDGFIIISVIDHGLQEAVAGLWLYMARDKKDQQIYLVANFTEMRAALALNDTLTRDGILAEMLRFAGEFAQLINAPFVLAALKYGYLPNWNVFDAELHRFEKIGAMCIDENYPDYYLKSLEEDVFFRYDASKIAQLYPHASSVISFGATQSLRPLNTASSLSKVGMFKANNNTAKIVGAKIQQVAPVKNVP